MHILSYEFRILNLFKRSYPGRGGADFSLYIMFKHLTRQTLQQAKRLSPQIALRPPSARIYARAIPRFIHNTSISFDNNTRPTFTPT